MSGHQSQRHGDLNDSPGYGAVQAAPRKVEVVLLVGLGATDTLPTVAGCIDAGTVEVIDPAETDARFAAMKREYLNLDPSMTFRRVTVHLDTAKLLKHFSGPVVEGEIGE